MQVKIVKNLFSGERGGHQNDYNLKKGGLPLGALKLITKYVYGP